MQMCKQDYQVLTFENGLQQCYYWLKQNLEGVFIITGANQTT